MKRIKLTLLLSTLFLIIIIFFKTKFNLDIDSKESEIILENINYNTAIVLFLLTNLFIVFISAFGTSLFLFIFANVDKKNIRDPQIKSHIYLYYIVGHSILNICVLIYSLTINDIANNLFVNVLNLLFFIILTYLLYIETKKILSAKLLFTYLSLIFILNSISAIWFFITTYI